MKVLAIYAEALKGPDATFETNVPTWSEWNRVHLPAHRLVAVEEPKKILGWAALSRFSERREYAGVVECYTFVRADARRRGVGTPLLTSADRGHRGAGAVDGAGARLPGERGRPRAAPQGRASRSSAPAQRMGRHRGRWRDVLLLERRSPAVA